MNMVCPDEGKIQILDELFRIAGARDTFVLDLFQNNEVVDDASTAADFTIATFTGYAQVAIARDDWNVAIILGGDGVIDTLVAPEFECTGGASQTVYGWILRGAGTGIIYFGQNFDTPRLMAPAATETIDPMRIRAATYT
jgi:hypothetical protein